MTGKQLALVTGAATGIGRACALALAEKGYSVAAVWRSQREAAESLLDELPGDGHALFQADVGQADAVQKLVAAVLAHYGRVDALVNAAGRFSNQAVDSADYGQWCQSWEDSLRVNLLGPVNLAQQVAQSMIAAGRGRIVNITSRGAFRGEPTAPAYGAAKSGLNSASQSLAVALAPHGISVFAVAPGWTETPQASPRIHGEREAEILADSPLGRVGSPDEIASLVAFLLSGNTEYLTGAIFDANGASYLRN